MIAGPSDIAYRETGKARPQPYETQELRLIKIMMRDSVIYERMSAGDEEDVAQGKGSVRRARRVRRQNDSGQGTPVRVIMLSLSVCLWLLWAGFWQFQ